jgi:hypothetical protein
MKMIHCDLCGTDIVLTRETITCNCMNIAGNYREDGIHADIYLKNEKSLMTSRVVGVSNSVMLGLSKRDIAHVGEWNDYQLHIYIDGTEKKYKDIKTPIIPIDEEAELIATIMEKYNYNVEDIKYVYEEGMRKVYKMVDGGIIYFYDKKDNGKVDEPIAIGIRLEDDTLIETKVCKFVMR